MVTIYDLDYKNLMLYIAAKPTMSKCNEILHNNNSFNSTGLQEIITFICKNT